MTVGRLSFESNLRRDKDAVLWEVCTLQTVVVQKGSLEDKILVPKPPRNCARWQSVDPVDGPFVKDVVFYEGIYDRPVKSPSPMSLHIDIVVTSAVDSLVGNLLSYRY
ncbi:hypothetical protein Tco_0353372 [Tanacetum coccineum]